MLDFLEKKDYNKIKQTLKDHIPYSIYKEFLDIYEKNNDKLLINSFFGYLCYLSEMEFKTLKSEIEKELNKEFSFHYNPVPLFNESFGEDEEKKTTTVLKPKIEYETLEKNVVLDLIEKQNKKEKMEFGINKK